MKQAMISVLALSAAAFGMNAASAKDAAAPSPARAAQQEKMKACNAEAKSAGKKGADRKAFMKECLSAKK